MTLHPNAIKLVVIVPISVYADLGAAGVGVLMLFAALSVANSGNYRSRERHKTLSVASAA